VLPTPKLRWNMFGATFGGPSVKRNSCSSSRIIRRRLDYPASSSFIHGAHASGDRRELQRFEHTAIQPMRRWNLAVRPALHARSWLLLRGLSSPATSFRSESRSGIYGARH